MERAARLIRNTKYTSEVFTDEDLARAIWPTAVGRAIAAHTLRVRLVRTKLVVEVEDAMWQRQLFPLTSQILTRVRKVTGSDIVRDIEFRVGVPRREAGRAESSDPLALVGLHGSGGSHTDEAENIQDAVLKKVYRLSRKKATA